MKDKKIVIYLAISYFLLVALKILASYFVKSPSIFADEYYYMKMARSFFYHGSFEIDGIVSDYPPLYPLFISFLYILKNPYWIYSGIKIFNSFLSSLIIIPLFFIAKDFFDEKKALLLSTIICLMPPFFIISNYILSENLFYPLFLFSVYFIYKSFLEGGYKYDILSGIFIALAFLTRVISLSLVLAIIIVFMLFLIRFRDIGQIRKKMTLFSVAFVIVLPWIIRNMTLFGFSLNGIFGYRTEVEALKNYSIYSNIYWIIVYASYLILASGIFFFITALLSLKNSDKKNFTLFVVSFSAISFLILLAAFHSSTYSFSGSWLVGRPLGRYIDAGLPLIILSGFIYINKLALNHRKLFIKASLVVFLLLLSSYKIIEFSLFPLNNSSLTHLGLLFLISGFVSKYLPILVFILIAASSLFSIYLLKLKFKKIVWFTIIYFSIISLISFAIVVYNANNRWYDLEQAKAGMWFSDYDRGKSTVLFDKNDIDQDFHNQTSLFDDKEISIGVAGYWLNNEIFIDYPNTTKNYDYLFTTTKKDLNFVYIAKIDYQRYLYIYKNEKN